MSLLGNIFRHGVKGEEKVPSAKEEPRGTHADSSSADSPAVAPSEESGEETELGQLDRIRRQLAEINEIIGEDDDEGGSTAISEQSMTLEISLSDLATTLPESILRDPAEASRAGIKVGVVVHDVFDQLARGRVSAVVSDVVSEIPDKFMADGWVAHAKEEVTLPLAAVVSAIPEDELLKRMSSEEVSIPEELPNLFTPGAGGEVAAGEVTVETSGAVAEPGPETQASAAQGAVSEEGVSHEGEEVGPQVVEAAAGVEEEPAAEESKVAESFEEVSEEATVMSDQEPAAAAVEEDVGLPAEAKEAEEAVEEAAAFSAEARAPEAEEGRAAEPLEVSAEGAGAEESPAAAVDTGTVVSTPSAPAAELVQGVPEEGKEESVGEKVPPVFAEEMEERAYLFLKGMDLNSAGADEIARRLDGVGRRLAERIVADRSKNGPFFNLLDLARVPGLGRQTFERITGIKLREDIFRNAGVINMILGHTRDGLPDVRGVAARFATIESFEGCVVAHREGYLVTSSWEDDHSEALGAFAPQIYKKIAWYIKQLDMGGLESLTVFIEGRPLTLVRSGDIFLVAIHNPRRFSRRDVRLVQAIGAELGRRLAAIRG